MQGGFIFASMSALPKLSYILLSHNRERYIRAAVESALAQDYEGELEYIFSDDCSTDRTYDIIQECVAAYRGNRRIVVTRTPHNMHLAGNTNHAVSFVKNDWIVRADDDDYSTVDRCSVIGKAIAQHPGCSYVATSIEHFTDADDAQYRQKSLMRTGDKAKTRSVSVREAAQHLFPSPCVRYSYQAWNAQVFRLFGPLDQSAYYVDDLTCYYRANMIGFGVYVENACTSFIRHGSGNMSRGGDDNRRDYASVIRLEQFNDTYFNITYEPLMREIAALRDFIRSKTESPEERRDHEAFLARLEEDMRYRADVRTYWRKGVANRIGIVRRYGTFNLFNILRCLPLPLFAFVLTLLRKIKN